MDETIQQSIAFLQAALAACKDKPYGTICTFRCPICGSAARAAQSPGNGHVHASCDSCKIKIHQ